VNVHEAYEKLGLEPLDDFLLRHGPAETRGIGATTWMLVEAALALHEGKDVVLVAHNLAYSQALENICVDFINKLGAAGTPRIAPTKRHIRFTKRGLGDLYTESDRTLERFLRGWGRSKDEYEVFSDGKWKLRALDRQKGPFACIRLIRCVHDSSTNKLRYYAWDDRGEYLMELTEDGAHDIAAAEGMRVQREGW